MLANPSIKSGGKKEACAKLGKKNKQRICPIAIFFI
jgi:hypothetical protein